MPAHKLELPIKSGNWKFKIKVSETATSKIKVEFPYSKVAVEWVKTLCGRKFNPDTKAWTIDDNAYNNFRLDYHSSAAGHPGAVDPYAVYDGKLPILDTARPLYAHQMNMTQHAMMSHYLIWACEMGTGKTLAAIETSELAGMNDDEVWYVGPKAGVKAVNLELLKWNCKVNWRMMTYGGLGKILREDQEAPRMVILDESSKIKNPTAQRSVAAAHLVNCVHDEHGMNGYAIAMSGTPAPKSPADWWHQCNTIQPGFLNAPNIHVFKQGLCLTETRESVSGQSYPKLVTWWDDSKKCKICGGFEEDHILIFDHPFEPSVNEVSRLYKRMQGLAIVHFSKDCLDLPELIFKKLKVRPTPTILQTCLTIKETSPSALKGLAKVREVCDGFMYKEVESKTEVKCCSHCHGEKLAKIYEGTVDGSVPLVEADMPFHMGTCPTCSGTGIVPVIERTIAAVGSPKDDVLREQLSLHEDGGRFIVWGGFTGTIDRATEIVQAEGWTVIRVDGRGYHGFKPDGSKVDADELLQAMDSSHRNYKNLFIEHSKVCFVGQPQSGGMALTLTASPTSLFFSNCFDGEARMQSVKRGHRAGMLNRAHTVIDLIMLPSDLAVLDNLNNKKRLQDLTLMELDKCMQITGEVNIED